MRVRFGRRGLATAAALGTGRLCPPHYGYSATKLALCATDEADTLLIAGGVYGNVHALDAIERRHAAERAAMGAGSRVRVALNGDFHFFNATPDAWDAINRRIHGAAPDGWSASLGNVEFEAAQLGGPELAGGCGCAYPEFVGDEVVSRSNAIVQRLTRAAFAAPGWSREWLGTLPMYAACRVGGARVSIVHGDPRALAGWALSAELFSEPKVRAWLEQADADIFASTHTCVTHARLVDRGPARPLGAVFNNGAAGMPCFDGELWGVMTRVSTDWARAPPDSIFGVALRELGVRVDAIRVRYSAHAWQRTWEGWWPEGSAARQGYGARMTRGLRDWTVERAFATTGDALREVRPAAPPAGRGGEQERARHSL
ncbi:hypothetical protein KFE25_005823 [Diacronema lutheri]|uniref:Calcineurin-like phosphoesterase domain-containing protein n=3 Tax=Diacronema lutheri TaxID=2081491 RepID=A0A8J5XK40_DIALT|nr:hypothetical protein KFE25_005823 [Diacronema lutheri]